MAELSSAEAREPSTAAMAQPCDFARWPVVPTKALIGATTVYSPPSSNAASQKINQGSRANEIQAVTWSR